MQIDKTTAGAAHPWGRGLKRQHRGPLTRAEFSTPRAAAGAGRRSRVTTRRPRDCTPRCLLERNDNPSACRNTKVGRVCFRSPNAARPHAAAPFSREARSTRRGAGSQAHFCGKDAFLWNSGHVLWKTSLWLPGVGMGAGMTGKGSRGGLGAFVKTGRTECHAVNFTVCKLNFFYAKKTSPKKK